MPRIPVTDLGGSINQGRAPSELAPGEWTDLSNFYQFGAKLVRRGGMRRLTTSPFATGRILGLVFYKPEVLPPGGVDMMAAGRTEWGVFVGSSISTIQRQTGFVIPTSSNRWVMFQYKNICYGIREAVGLVRSDGTYVGPAGIEAPTVAPTLADGGAGAIPAAIFKAVYTFYNANTDMESNPSPVSNSLVLGANRKIDWSGIAVSPNPQVTSRRIYRTLPDQSGEYFLVDEIENNSATTFTGDNVLAQDLGEAVSHVNGTPPSGLLYGTVWKERLFASDSKDLFHSEDGLIEAFDPNAVIPVFPDDGHLIRAIHAYGDRLVIGKTNKIHYLVGSDPDTFALLTLTDRHGCISHHTMQSAEGYLFWLGADNVYRSDGNAVTGIASVKLKNIIANLSDAVLQNATAEVFPSLGWYVISIPQYAQIIYNYRTDVWTTAPTATDMLVMADFRTAEFVQQILATDTQGHIYRFNDADYSFDDTSSVLGNAITATFTTRAFGGDGKVVNEYVSLLCQRYAENIALAIVSEGATIKSRTVSLDFEPRWKLYSLSTRHQAKSMVQLKATYTGATQIELEGFALDIAAIARPSMMAR